MFGINEKGGMDEVELEQYVMGSNVPLYPDFMDAVGKCVMIKVDSDPGHMNKEFLA